MNTNSKKGLMLALAAVILIALSAGASAFVTKNQLDKKEPEKASVQTSQTTHKVRREQVNWNQPAQPQPQPQQVSRCDDGNIIGAGLGAAAGGLIGHQFGSGKGKDLATIGGAIAGGAAGHEYIPTRNTLCR